MPCHVPRSSVPRRRQSPCIRSAPPPIPLTVLDLSKPGERRAHDFLCRATSQRTRMWTLSTLQRQGEVLLCVVRWIRHDNPAEPCSLVEVSLTEAAVRWWDYASTEAARAAMEHRCATVAPREAVD